MKKAPNWKQMLRLAKILGKKKTFSGQMKKKMISNRFIDPRLRIYRTRENTVGAIQYTYPEIHVCPPQLSGLRFPTTCRRNSAFAQASAGDSILLGLSSQLCRDSRILNKGWLVDTAATLGEARIPIAGRWANHGRKISKSDYYPSLFSFFYTSYSKC